MEGRRRSPERRGRAAMAAREKERAVVATMEKGQVGRDGSDDVLVVDFFAC
jgi:hypothetical protein